MAVTLRVENVPKEQGASRFVLAILLPGEPRTVSTSLTGKFPELRAERTLSGGL